MKIIELLSKVNNNYKLLLKHLNVFSKIQETLNCTRWKVNDMGQVSFTHVPHSKCATRPFKGVQIYNYLAENLRERCFSI